MYDLFMIRVVKPALLILLISDFYVGITFFRVSVFLSLLFIPRIYSYFKPFLVLAFALQFLSLLGAATVGSLSLFDLALSFNLLTSLLQISTIVYLCSASCSFFPKSDTYSCRIDYILWYLALIGFFQIILGADRPPFVFYETNYIGFWLPVLYCIHISNMYFYRNDSALYLSSNNNLFAPLSSLLVPTFLLLAESRSLTMFFVIILFFSPLAIICFLKWISKFIFDLKVSPDLLLFLILAPLLLVYFVTNFSGNLLILRLVKLLQDPLTVYGLSGYRYLQFQEAQSFFSSLPFDVKMLGGMLSATRELDSISLPATGVFSLLAQYGFLGMSLVVANYCSIANAFRKHYNLFFYFLSYSMFALVASILLVANLTYSGILFFPCIWLVLLEKKKLFLPPQVNS